MDPLSELCNNLTELIGEISRSKNQVDVQGQKVLLDALRSLLISTENLSKQVKILVELQVRSESSRPKLYLVE